MSQQHPQFQQQPYQPAPPKPPKRTSLKVAWILLAVFGTIAVVGTIIGAVDDATRADKPATTSPSTFKTVDTGPSPEPVVTPTNKPVAPKPAKTAPKLTASQEQAIGSAESYLAFTAFSRKGLIRQLSSAAGEGFSVADATFAVDHVKVDWNEQAAKSAKQYLEMSHFSRQGLIHQLESSAGEGFTHAQAVYGVNKAGL